MTDDVTNPVADDEVIPPEVAAEPENEIELEEGEGDDLQPAEEEIEVEREGKKYRIPKALEKELLLHADYTRKTQEVAERRKAIELQEAQVKQRFEANEAFIDDLAKLRGMDSQLDAYSKADWNRIRQADPQKANELFQQYVLLKDARDAAARDIDQRAKQRQFDQQQETAKLIEQGRAKLADRIPNWNQEVAVKLVEFGAREFGFTTDELSGIVDPRAVETLYYARIGKEFIAKQKAAASKPQQPEIVPTPTVAAKRAAPTTNLYQIKDPERWAEIRNKQEAARRRR